MNTTLGTRIGELRRAKGLTQEQVAEALGLSPQAVSKWENDISCPDITALPPLAKLLGVSVDTLLTGQTDTSDARYVPPEQRKSFNDMMLRIRMDSADKSKVRINLPLPLIKVLLASGASMEGFVHAKGVDKIDFSQIIAMVESGMIGKLLEMDDEDDHVEIVVE